MASCPDCGEELDEFSPCACAVTRRMPVFATRQGVRVQVGPLTMRQMVARKLERQRKGRA